MLPPLSLLSATPLLFHYARHAAEVPTPPFTIFRSADASSAAMLRLSAAAYRRCRCGVCAAIAASAKADAQRCLQDADIFQRCHERAELMMAATKIAA